LTGSLLGTASYALNANISIASASYLSGSTAIVSQLTASNANITIITASEMYASGTNVFGDSSLDIHRFIGSVEATGSVIITGSLTVIGPITGTSSFATSASFATTASYALNAAGSETSGISIEDIWMYSGM